MKTKLFTLLLAVAVSVGTMYASDTQVNGIWYDFDSSTKTASVTYRGDYYASYGSEYSGSVVIPASVTYNSVKYSVTSIGEDAFRNCTGLTSVTIPNSVTSIGKFAFCDCSGLTSVTLGNGVTSIGYYAFGGCSGSPIYNAHVFAFMPGSYSGSYAIPDGIESIADCAFYFCSGLTSVTIPNSVTSIGFEAFYNCRGLTSVTIGNSVTSIGGRAFGGCSGLTSVTIPNSVTSIGEYAFSYCSGVTSVTIPNSVTYIGYSTFSGCTGLTSVMIPNSVTSIGSEAFYNCSGLTSVTIGNSVTSIGEDAFRNCTGLTSVTIEAETPPTLGANALSNTNNCPIYVPCGTLDAYKTAWTNCASRISYAPLPYKISTQAVYGSVGITSLEDYTTCDEQPYHYTLAVTANYGYHFVQWSDGNTDNPRTFVLTQDTTFTAEFAKNTYTISTVSANPVWGTTSGDKSSLYLENVVISAIANYGYHFVKWNDNNTENPRTISVTKDATYTATFAKNTYSITKIANSTQGSISGVSQAEYLDNITLTAVPSYGYHFTQWSDGNTNNPRTFILTQDTTFTAEFARNTYTISTVSANPEWGTTAGDKSVLYLENVVISATANYGYHFVKWNDNNTENPRIVSVTGDKTYTAIFAKDIFSITANAEHGSISGSSSAEYLDEVILSVSSDYGYHFTQWSDGVTDNPRTIILANDTTFTAEFAKNTYTISTTSANQEWGTTTGDKSALYLDEVEISATANYGYHFAKWNDNNTSNPRIVSVTGDKTYTAIFAKNTYSITANAEHGSISGSSSAEYLDEVTLSVSSDYGYHFTQWNDGNTDNPRTFVLTRDTTFTAEFAVDKSGTCGKDNLLQWTFADDGTLTISGNGELTENYTFGLEAPTQMQQLVIGNEVTSIGERAFYEKTTLQKLIIGSNVTSIGKYAFASINNRQLTSLVMPAELLTIGDYAFSGNTYVESIDFNAKLQSIGAYAFKDCYRVSEMTCLATVTPDLGTDALASINSYASLCVPAECLRKYQVDPNWGRFDLCELGASSTTTDGKTVIVEPSDNTALFTWPTENNAGSYTLQISKDGEVFCTLVFNSNGQLTGIAFAPGRNGTSHAPAATTSVAGMSFTVTGLNSASKYAYRLAVTNDASEELVAYSGEFATTGYAGEVNPGGNPEGINDVQSDDVQCTKVLRDGQIFILRGDKTYTLQGQEVK